MADEDSVAKALMYSRREAKPEFQKTIYTMRDGKITTDREVALEANNKVKETKP